MSAVVALAPGESVARARRLLTEALAAAGFDAPALEARLLVAHALGLDHAALLRDGERLLSEAETERLGALARRRLDHEPIAHILGRREFWGLPLRVTPATLVPRPDTETVVEAALRVLAQDGPRTPRIADLGTGSGAILLALVHELPQAVGVGTDRSADALAVARDNARALALADRALFACSDFGQALRPPFDLVVSNPPYIPRADIATLAGEVRDHEPRAALDGGVDGLDAYRAIAPDLARLLAPGGSAVLEIGVGQAESVARVLADAGLALRGTPVPDLAGIPRVLVVTAR